MQINLSNSACLSAVVSIFCATCVSAPSQEANTPNAGKSDTASALYIHEDAVSWQITRPELTWRLDQKVLDELKLSNSEVRQREHSLRSSLVKSMTAEAALTASLSASVNARSTLSLNPLKTLTGNGVDMKFAAESALSGKLGATWSNGDTRTTDESDVIKEQVIFDRSFVRAISDPRLQFTVTIRNTQSKDLSCKNLTIPIWGTRNILAQAIPVDAEGQRLTEFTIPANRPGGVDQMFVAKISDTAFWDFINGGGLEHCRELQLERGGGQIMSGVDGIDLISQKAAELRQCIRVNVEFPAGAIMTWWVARRSTSTVAGRPAEAKVSQILTTINESLRNQLAAEGDAFCLEDGVLVSALGDDQYLSGNVWEISTGGREIGLYEDLRTINATGVRLRKRARKDTDKVAVPPTRAKDWALLVASRHDQRTGPFSVSFDQIKALAAKDGPWRTYAYNRLGNKYENGEGTTNDVDEAVKWYRKAAETGNPDGMVNLGIMYCIGKGFQKDAAEAMKWFHKAADAGNANGLSCLGVMYQNGEGVKKDAAEAIEWYRKAADAGSINGMVNLGRMYSDGADVQKDATAAVKWLRRAADEGDANGMWGLGCMYQIGDGVAKNTTEAVKWYRKAADAGNADGMASLGWMYAEGAGVAKDSAEAMKWYRTAAEGGSVIGMNNLGVMYLNGEGVAKDAIEAAKWYRKSAEAGYVVAMLNLGSMYAKGEGVIKDAAEAVKWYRKAAEYGNADGMRRLGWLYQIGEGVAQDATEAEKWYKRAANAHSRSGNVKQ
jgi:TPR repeat protein